tara:strand:+ start:221 stop:445 length:225 start_codon:yes stop_codon:yes gene_type:complete
MSKTIYSKRKIEYVTAMSTAILAFTAVIGACIAIIQFIELRFNILGFGGSLWLVTAFMFGLLLTISRTRRTLKK